MKSRKTVNSTAQFDEEDVIERPKRKTKIVIIEDDDESNDIPDVAEEITTDDDEGYEFYINNKRAFERGI